MKKSTFKALKNKIKESDKELAAAFDRLSKETEDIKSIADTKSFIKKLQKVRDEEFSKNTFNRKELELNGNINLVTGIAIGGLATTVAILSVIKKG